MDTGKRLDSIGRRAFLSIAAGAMTVLASIGCGPEWTVVRQTTTSPVTRSSTVVIEPINFEDLHIGDKPESDWLAKKSDKQRSSWESDKIAINEAFLSRFIEETSEKNLRVAPRSKPGPGVIFLRTVVRKIEPGYYAGIVASGAEFDARVDIADQSGVVEQVTFKAKGMTRFSIGERVREAGAATGQMAAEYLLSRIP